MAHPTWGRGDQAGASNRITPEKVLEAVRLVKTGKIYEVGQVYEKGMPLFGQRTYALLSPASPTYSFPGGNRLVGNDEFLCAEIGQVGTQFDGPGHIGMKVTMADGSAEDVYYNGFTGDEMYVYLRSARPPLTRGHDRSSVRRSGRERRVRAPKQSNRCFRRPLRLRPEDHTSNRSHSRLARPISSRNRASPRTLSRYRSCSERKG